MAFNKFYLKLYTSNDSRREKWEQYFSDTYLELNYEPRPEDLINITSFMDSVEDKNIKELFKELKKTYNSDYLQIMNKIHCNNDKCILLVSVFKPKNSYHGL